MKKMCEELTQKDRDYISKQFKKIQWEEDNLDEDGMFCDE